jgi:CheY-like chemotaxis protein
MEGPRILCVDDRAENLRVRAIMLEQFGCEAITAPDGAAALQLLASQSIDLMLIDYHLADGETGEEIAREVRQRWPKVPMIMLTGDSKLPDSAIAAVDEVIIKGTNPRILLDTIEKLLPEGKLKPRREMLIPEPVKRTG